MKHRGHTPLRSALYLPLLLGLSSFSGHSLADDKQEFADTVYQDGKIYTVDADNSWAQALAVRDGKILRLGSDAELAVLIGEHTEVVDLDGKMLMPGIHDTHMHPVDAGIQKTLECSFSPGALDAMLATVADCATTVAKGRWIRGGQWDMGVFKDVKLPKTLLDKIAPEHPVFLMDWSVHNAWLNSKALSMLGIDDNTPDPNGGVIVRDPETGEATGLLLDNAAYDGLGQLPSYSKDQLMTALQWSFEQMLSNGITSFKEAMASSPSMAAYRELAQQNKLPLRAATHLSWKSSWAPSHEDELALIEKRDEYRSDRLNVDFIKIMLDGIPPTYTAALLEPYEANDTVGDQHRGKLIFSPEELSADVTILDAKGLTVKIHATGDRSLRVALDAIAAARKANGDSGLQHEVSHAEMIHPDDLARFAELKASPELCPIMWYPMSVLPWEELVGKERAHVWAIRDLVESGALPIYGSDWQVAPTPNPWPGLEAMVTRTDPYTNAGPAAWPEQSIDLATAVRIYTINGAHADKSQASNGSLEVGKDADFIVLNQNIFEVEIQDVSDTEVLMTVVDGETVYGDL